jgi:hypothetical protein
MRCIHGEGFGVLARGVRSVHAQRHTWRARAIEKWRWEVRLLVGTVERLKDKAVGRERQVIRKKKEQKNEEKENEKDIK